MVIFVPLDSRLTQIHSKHKQIVKKSYFFRFDLKRLTRKEVVQLFSASSLHADLRRQLLSVEGAKSYHARIKSSLKYSLISFQFLLLLGLDLGGEGAFWSKDLFGRRGAMSPPLMHPLAACLASKNRSLNWIFKQR